MVLMVMMCLMIMMITCGNRLGYQTIMGDAGDDAADVDDDNDDHCDGHDDDGHHVDDDGMDGDGDGGDVFVLLLLLDNRIALARICPGLKLKCTKGKSSYTALATQKGSVRPIGQHALEMLVARRRTA